MKDMKSMKVCVALGASSMIASAAGAQVTVYQNNGFAAWSAASGNFATVDFTGFPVNTFITNQYSSLGVVFTNFGGPEVVWPFAPQAFPQDGYGVDGNEGIEMLFTQPMHSIATHSPGIWRMQLFNGNQMFFQSPWMGGQNPNFFGGLTSVQSFDRVRFVSFPGDDVAADNIYFSTVPGPAAGVVIVCGALFGGRRRRC
jgi:hypothetical protein